MGEKKEYRSSIRSKKLIREAFLQLLQEKDFQKITVTDIVNLADINRATFYAHYPDVRGLLEEMENEIVMEMYSLLSEFDYNAFFDDPDPLMRKLIHYLEKDSSFFRILLSSGGASPFVEKIKKLFEQYMSATEDIPDCIRNSSKYKIRISYFSGGIVNILIRWLVGDLACAIDDIVSELCALLSPGLI